MPIALSSEAVERALALLGEHDLTAPQDVEAALGSMAVREDEAEPIVLSRYDLQLFLWYQLPRKFLAPLEAKEEVASALGRFLELTDGPASYAELCRSPKTQELLRAWEEEQAEADKLLREALDASGLEPPDTEALEWGMVMGLEEARFQREVALELERAVEDGRLVLSEGGFKRRQAELVIDLLRRPRPELEGRSALDVVHGERLERWTEHGSAERRELVSAVAPLLQDAGPDAIPGLDTDRALGSLVWLLDAAADNGLALTQTGALNRALVRKAVGRFPDWWDTDLFGLPHREDEVFRLRLVHDLARRMRLLRRRGRKLHLTKKGEALRRDRTALLGACAPHLLGEEDFEAAVQELVAALLLRRGSIDRDQLEAEVHAAIVSDGWHADGEPPPIEAVAGTAAGFIALAAALGLLDCHYQYRPERRSRRELEVRPAGVPALRAALIEQATRPATTL
jgi:hypothetical protein